MYAVVAQSGKQSIFRPGEVVDVDQIKAEIGETVTFDKVLCLHDGKAAQFGKPLVSDVKVTAKVVAHHRDKKIRIIHFKRRKHHMTRMGHRQNYTRVEILEIVTGKAKKPSTAKKTTAAKKPAAAKKTSKADKA